LDEIEAEFNSPPGEQIWNFHIKDPFSLMEPTKIVGSPTEDVSIEWMREEEFSEDEDTFAFEDIENSQNYTSEKPKWVSMKQKIHKSLQPHQNIILYIQMQLCEDTLQGWLESCVHVDRITVLSIFRQILQRTKVYSF